MQTLTSYFDIAQVSLYAFWIFFFGLVFWLHREDKREGYPLVSEIPGHTEEFATDGFLRPPPPKMFRLFHGGVSFSPETQPPRFPVNARPAAMFPGAPLDPIGNPLVDGIGPASWAYRKDEPDLTIEGKIKIVPLRAAEHYHLDPRSPDPRGMDVIGSDRLVAGQVVDVWIDEIEEALRYLEVRLTIEGAFGDHVLVPEPFIRVRPRRNAILVRSIMARQFAQVPRLRVPTQVTRLEEDKITGYFGGGALYGAPSRLGPML